MPSFRRIDNPSYPICNPIKKGKKINKKISDFLTPRLATMGHASNYEASEFFKKASNFQEKCQRLQRLSDIHRGKNICRIYESSFENFQ